MIVNWFLLNFVVLFLMFKKVTVTAPAKVNLHLAVLDRRSDGFHNLQSIFLTVDFGDILHFEPIDGKNAFELSMVGFGKGTGNISVPLQDNIIFKALSLFREKTGFNQGLGIKAEKRIPFGSGLGGGSSDAASTLLTLNKIAGNILRRDELLEMAASLGSDVPFFIHETGAALVTGRGECITPIEAPGWFFVLVYPGFPSSTAEAFRLLDKSRAGKLNNDFTSFPVTSVNLRDLCESNFSPIFFNDFLDVFEEKEKTVYNKIISRLRELGADYASLSGSGSACFGIFKQKSHAEKAAEFLRSEWSFSECCSSSYV